MAISKTRRNRIALVLIAAFGIPALFLGFQNFTYVPGQQFDIREAAPPKPNGYGLDYQVQYMMFKPSPGASLESLENDWISQHTQPYLDKLNRRLNDKLNPDKNEMGGHAPGQNFTSVDQNKAFDFHFDAINKLRMGERDHFNMTCLATPQEVHLTMTQPISTHGNINLEHQARSGLSTLNIGWTW